MKILVTGADGFIGSHLVETLLAQGHDVRAFVFYNSFNYSSIDDKIDDFHYYSTFIKFGIGRATYDASQEVRNGDITREEAVALIKRYDGEYPERFEKENLAYLSLPEREFPLASKRFEQPVMDRAYFEALIDRFRSPHIWQKVGGVWTLRKTIHGDR